MNKKITFALIFISLIMTSPLWGSLAKTQDNPQTIAEYIAEKIAEHNNNTIAHNEPGQSLDLHRKDTVIDHPAGSVKSDKKSVQQFEYSSQWSDFNSWNKSAGVSSDDGSASFSVDGDNNVYNFLWKYIAYDLALCDLNKSYAVDIFIKTESVLETNDKVVLGIGGTNIDGNFPISFEWSGGHFYAVYVSSQYIQGQGTVFTKHKNQISDLVWDQGDIYHFKMEYIKGENVLRWYINDNLVYEVYHSQNSFDAGNDASIFFGSKTGSTGMAFHNFYLIQPRFVADWTY